MSRYKLLNKIIVMVIVFTLAILLNNAVFAYDSLKANDMIWSNHGYNSGFGLNSSNGYPIPNYNGKDSDVTWWDGVAAHEWKTYINLKDVYYKWQRNSDNSIKKDGDENIIYGEYEEPHDTSQFYYDRYSNGSAKIVLRAYGNGTTGTWWGDGYVYMLAEKNTYAPIKRFDIEEFMNTGDYASDFRTEVFNKLGKRSYLQTEDYNNGNVAGIKYRFDPHEVILVVHPNVWCIDYKTGSNRGDGLYLANVFDVEDGQDKTLTTKLYYTSKKPDGSFSGAGPYENNLANNNQYKYAAKLAYLFYYCGQSENLENNDSSKGRTRAQQAEFWERYFKNISNEFYHFFKDNYGSKIYFQEKDDRDDIPSNHGARLTSDANAYATFAVNRRDAGGKTMVASTTASPELASATNGAYVEGIKFSTFVGDAHNYAKSSDRIDYTLNSSGGYYNGGTIFTVKVTAELEDGSKITEGLKVYNGTTEITDLRTLSAGTSYRVFVPGNNADNVENIIFTTEYWVYNGRIIISDGCEGNVQTRAVVGGTSTKVTDTVSFKVESKPVNVFTLLKKDSSNDNNVTGVKFKVEVNGKTFNNVIPGQILTSSQVGISSSGYTGTLTYKLTETTVPEGYIGWNAPKQVTVTYENGVIEFMTSEDGVSVQKTDAEVVDKNGTATGETVSGAKATITAYNATEKPALVLKKTDLKGSALKNAVFSATLEKNGKSTTITELKTNDAGEVIIFASQLAPIGADVLDKFIGDIKITLKETAAPDGYRLITNDIVVTATYNNGAVTMSSSDSNVTVTTSKVSYKDADGNTKETTLGTIVIKDEALNKLRIRKVDGDTSSQEYLENASFKVDVNANGTTKSVTKTTDSKGYIDITDTVNQAVGDLGRYSGDIKVTLSEQNNPSGFLKITDKITVILTYANGYLSKVTYQDGDNLSKDIIDVGESEDRKDVTIAVKNTKKELQPIYISKVDSQTGAMLSNVDFKVAIATSEIADGTETTIYKTSDDGLIAITKDKLEKIGLTDYYTGELYILMEEVAAKAGYKKLDEKVYVKVTYNNGNIESADVISGPATATISTNNDAKMLKITVQNEWKIPEIVISKESLSNELTDLIITANLSVEVTASGKTGKLNKNGLVDKNAQIVFTSEELETLGLDGRYSGTITVKIKENSVSEQAAKLPETVTATLNMQNGRFVSGDVSNKVHLSIVDNKTSINVKVLNYKRPEDMPISGIVWEELATTKAQGTLIDGLYTTASDSEYSDKLFEGIEVTLYKKVGSKLEFVNVEKGTNPTFTDSNGHYEFSAPGATSDYIVKFTYNGQAYYSAPSREYDAHSEFDSWKISSKGSEVNGNNTTKGTRNYINNLLSEIGSYPANYKMKQAIFASSKIQTENNLRTAYAAGYNIAYRYDELRDIYKEIATEMKEELLSTQNIDISTQVGLTKLLGVYDKVAAKYSSDKEIYNKLQYIYDTRIDSYAGYFTNGSGVNSATAVKGFPYEKETSKDYIEQQYVNLGLVKRDMTDLSLLNDVSDIVTTINGHSVTYSFGKGYSTYTHYLYEEDYNYGTTPNSNGDAWYQDDQIELFVTYKSTVTNSTNTSTKLTEIVDYYDTRFEYAGVVAKKVKADGTTTDINNVSASTNGKYIEASRLGLDGANGYNEMFVTFANGSEPSIVDGEKVDIYITFKLGNSSKSAKELLNEFVTDSNSLTEYNYSEVNGYITDKGYLDADSKPGTMKVKEYEDAREEYNNAYANRRNDKERFARALEELNRIREDDAWCNTLNFRKDSNNENKHHRTINGNIWEAVNDEVKNAYDLQSHDLLTYVADKGIEGIVVELVELEEGNQTVRARTVTASDGSYTFSKYIPGEYVVRFIYGAETRDGYTDEQIAKISEASKTYNGQRYQSTKANENTDSEVYWYDESTRYSDAYDDANSRVGSEIQGIEYDYTAAMTPQVGRTISAYTSTIVVEGEYTETAVEGNVEYTYNVANIDFGLTPRIKDQLDLDKYVSNIKVYLQDGTLQLDANIDENGNVTYLNDERYTNIVLLNYNSNAYLDGLIETLIDEQLLNGATLEITYGVKLTNNSQRETLRYIYSTAKGTTPIAVLYYGEDYRRIPFYESDRGNTIMYHDNAAEKYSLETYASYRDVDVETAIRDIVDYIDPNLSFVAINKAGQLVNQDWVMTSTDTFNSSRKTNADIMSRYTTIIRPSETNPLFGTVGIGESVSTTLTLSKVLATSSTDTNDYEYSNLIEITKLYNNIGRTVEIEGYDITGTERPETSKPVSPSEIKDNIYPTLGTAKSETLVIHAPTGLNSVEKILSNTVIVLISLVVLAGGIILIKKFVLTQRN